MFFSPRFLCSPNGRPETRSAADVLQNKVLQPPEVCIPQRKPIEYRKPFPVPKKGRRTQDLRRLFQTTHSKNIQFSILHFYKARKKKADIS